jgi:hypothetical protein
MIDIYETPYGNVEINVDAQRAIVAVSSGFDSALMLYVTALAAKKYNPALEIYPVTARRMNSQTSSPDLVELFGRVDNYANAVKVVEWVRSCFPEIDIKDNILYDSYFWQYCQEDPIMGIRNTYIMAQKMPQMYALSLPYQWDADYSYDAISLNGVTKNPDFELSGCNPEVHRNFKIPTDDAASASVQRVTATNMNIIDQTFLPKIRVLMSEPFRNADKRITFWMADDLKILDTLSNISRSCEGRKESTNNWTEECHECWWCYERKWAQETYKNQQPAEQEKYKSTDYFNSFKGNTQ